MRQTSLFEPRVDEARPGLRHRDASDTERAAAAKIAPRSGTQRAAVYNAIAFAGPHGMTDWEIVDATGILRSAVCARRNELVRDGFVMDSGRRRLERTGSKAIVWIARRKDTEGGGTWRR